MNSMYFMQLCCKDHNFMCSYAVVKRCLSSLYSNVFYGISVAYSETALWPTGWETLYSQSMMLKNFLKWQFTQTLLCFQVLHQTCFDILRTATSTAPVPMLRLVVNTSCRLRGHLLFSAVYATCREIIIGNMIFTRCIKPQLFLAFFIFALYSDVLLLKSFFHYNTFYNQKTQYTNTISANWAQQLEGSA